jgi:predicted nucleic acid-binding protein
MFVKDLRAPWGGVLGASEAAVVACTTVRATRRRTVPHAAAKQCDKIKRNCSNSYLPTFPSHRATLPDLVLVAKLFEKCTLGQLVVCECVLAEIIPALGEDETGTFLSDWKISFEPLTVQSAALAGEMYRRYLERRGEARRVLPDFLIGAHAALHAPRLLARDRGYYRDYFQGLDLIEPTC